MQKNYKKYIEVSCLKCSLKFQKRKDGVKEWNGHCRKCSYAVRNENEEWKNKISKTLTGKFVGELHHNWVEPKSCIDCNSPLPKKSKNPIRCKKCFDNYHKGENHWNWQNGLSEKNHLIRISKEYLFWAKSVKERDNYTCVICGIKKQLESDHIKPFSLYPELRFDINNGRTLCKKCHQEHGWSLFKENNPRRNAELVRKTMPRYGQHILCINNGKVYFSHTHAAKSLNLQRAGISKIIEGKATQTKGYMFQKLTEEHLIF